MSVLAAARMRRRWRVAEGRDAPVDSRAVAALASTLRIPPLVARLLVLRGLEAPAEAERFLHPTLHHLHDPRLLPGCEAAARRIELALRQRQPIVIYGDYDVDGVTASAILWHLLSHLGGVVTTYVPHRVEEGYGLNEAALTQLCAARPQPLIISVDCGITALGPARAAREAGADLIITDHHELDPQRLPEACACVHPRLPGDGPAYPFHGLSGAGVALKLAWQVARAVHGSDRVPTATRELLVDLLSFAALGTIADVTPLTDENRAISYHGLGRIKHTRFPGLNALIDAASLRDAKIDAFHVGFVLGPRLNACGRMGHARDAVRLFTDAPPEQCDAIAQQLTQENQKRQATERAIVRLATEQVEAAGYDAPSCRAIVVAGEGWHPGVVGIVASRLVDAYARPAIVLSIDPPASEGPAGEAPAYGADAGGPQAHGSARSVEGLALHEALRQCSAHLRSFGGHAMAAGLRLPASRIDDFRQAFVHHVNGVLTEDDLARPLNLDAQCALEDVELDLARHLQKLAPFGAGNRAPILCARGVTVAQAPTRVGSQGAHLRLMVKQGEAYRQAFGRGMGERAAEAPAGATLDIAFEPHVGHWQGRDTLEMHLRDFRPAAS